MNRLERLILAFISIVCMLGISSDLLVFNIIPNFMISKVEDFPAFVMMIYQLQVTITTLSIALIALMSGASHETVYGVPVAHYIMQLKPRFLKHKNIITTLLSFILASYFFISFGMYNSVVAIFFITIVLIIFMSNQIFTVFQGRDELKIEISRYIEKNSLDINVLNLLFRDIFNSIDSDETIRFKENMNLLIMIFNKSINLLSNNEALKLKWQENLEKVFVNAFSKARGTILKLSYSYFDETYEIISKEDSIAKELDLWDGITNEFFYGIKFFDIEELNELSVFASIRSKVYKCQYYKISDEKIKRNNYSVELIFSRIYLSILLDNNKVSKFRKSDIIAYKKRYYDVIKSDVEYKRNNDAIPIILDELLKYTKLLIDNLEGKVLKETFISELNRYGIINTNDEEISYNFSIIIYLYYLAYKEKLVDEEMKIFSSKFLEGSNNFISDYLLSISFKGPLTKSIINMIRKNLDWWEMFPEFGVKTMILEGIIDTFLIFYTIYTEKNIDLLKETITSILEVNIFGAINSYTGENKTSTIDSYKGFVKKAFNADLDDNTAGDDLDRLEKVLYEIYRLTKIEEAEINLLDEGKILVLENSIKEKITESIIPKFKVLDIKEDTEEVQDGLYELKMNFDTRFIESMLAVLEETAYNYFVNHIIKLLIQEKQIICKDVVIRDTRGLVYFFDIIESNDIDINTLIGYKDRYPGYE